MSYNINDFDRLAVKVPYLGFDHAQRQDILSQIASGSLIRVYAGDDALDETTFNNQGLLALLYLGESEAEFDDPPSISSRISAAQSWCSTNGITPMAVEVGEERFWRCLNGDLSNYQSLASLDPIPRTQRVAQQYALLYAEIREAWPNALTVSVEASWTEPGATGLGTGFGLYGPIYDNVDVLGISHYMPGTDTSVNQAQLDVFCASVVPRVTEARRLVNVPGGSRDPYYRAAYTMAFAQAFDDGNWRKRSAGQLDWWYRMAQRTDERLDGLLFFCAEDRAGVTGAESYSYLVTQIGDIYDYNAQQ